MNNLKILLLLFVGSLSCFGQTFSINEVLSFTRTDQESLSELLIKRGWGNHNFETITDSSFNRRTWIKENPYNNLKSYVIHHDFGKDTSENYLIYQFFDRAAIKEYKSYFDGKKYKKLKSKTKKEKKNKHDKNIHKEYSELYYSEEQNSVVVLKDVFFYGMNTFLIYSYRYNSGTGKEAKQNFNH